MLAALLNSQTRHFSITPGQPLVGNDSYFPLALAPDAFWRRVRADGGNVRVYTQDGTPCARELAAFDPVAKTGGLYFKNNGGTSFWVGSGLCDSGPTDDAALGKHNVWPSSAKAVWHLADLTDSTSNGHVFQATTATVVDAKMGKGYQFTGRTGSPPRSQALYQEAASDLDPTTAFTVVSWYKHLGTDADGAIFSKWFTNSFLGYMLWKQGGVDNIGLHINGSRRISTPTMTIGNWYFVAARWDGSKLYLRSNTTDVTPVDYAIAPQSAGYGYAIGGYWYTSGGGAIFSSVVDEVRVYPNTFLSDAVLSEMYAQQSSPETYWSVGAAR